MMKKNASRPSAKHGRCSPPRPTPTASCDRVQGGAFDAAVVAHSGWHGSTRSGGLEHPLPSPGTSPQLHVPGGGAGGAGLPTAFGHDQRAGVLRRRKKGTGYFSENLTDARNHFAAGGDPILVNRYS